MNFTIGTRDPPSTHGPSQYNGLSAMAHLHNTDDRNRILDDKKTQKNIKICEFTFIAIITTQLKQNCV